MSVTTKRGAAASPLAISCRCRVTSRGPNWLFVSVESPCHALGLAERLRGIAESQFVYRLVVEFTGHDDQADPIRLADELRALEAWLEERGGMLRLCGLRPEVAAAVLDEAGCGRLRNHDSQYDAVWGGERDAPNDRSAEETVVETHPRFRPR